MKCKKCDKKVQLNYVSLICIEKPQDYVLAQCPICKSVDTVPVEIWYDGGKTE